MQKVEHLIINPPKRINGECHDECQDGEGLVNGQNNKKLVKQSNFAYNPTPNKFQLQPSIYICHPSCFLPSVVHQLNGP
jgi:hypothetical protein